MNPTASHPRRYRAKRLALLLGFAVLFFWLPLEDVTERSTVLISAAILATAGAAFLQRYTFPPLKRAVVYAITGVAAGLAITPLALLLMALKTGLHGHSVPDFSPTQMMAVIRNTPIWIGAGFMTGLGAGLWPKKQ